MSQLKLNRTFFVPLKNNEMGRIKAAEIEALILKLLTKQSEVSISSIAPAVGLSSDDETERKAIRRALISLERQNLIIPKGEKRGRVYVMSAKGAETTKAAEKG